MASSTNSPRLKEENNLGDKGGQIVGNARDLASNVADLAKDVATSIGQKAEGAAHAVGSGVQSLGSTVRDRLPHSGVVGTAAASLADGLESGGHYLQEEGFTGIAKDLTNIIRRNPVPAILVGVAAGFLLARVTARR
jgi:ElaB/YqjD/DUF883 family membrane-anchored ribosome-binding protein